MELDIGINPVIELQMSKPHFEYRTTFAPIPLSFPDFNKISEDLARISPKPPKGEDWRLVSSSSVTNVEGGTTVLYFWERELSEPRALRPALNHGMPDEDGTP